MTWHEYLVNGVAPTVWLLILGGGCALLTVEEVRDRRAKGRDFGAVVTGSTAFIAVVALCCLGALAGRLDASRHRHAPVSAASSSIPGSNFTAPALQPTARCYDGTVSYSAHHQGTCSHHGGVADWLDIAPAPPPVYLSAPAASPVVPFDIPSPAPVAPVVAVVPNEPSPRPPSSPSPSPTYEPPQMVAYGNCDGTADTCTWDATVAAGSKAVSLRASDFTLHMHYAKKDYTGRASVSGPSTCHAPAHTDFQSGCRVVVGFDIPAGEQIDGQTIHVTVEGRDLHANNN